MIPAQWLHTLRLEQRKPPEFVLPSDNLTGISHGALIRQSFDELGLAAIHCVSDVPSIAFLVQESFDQDNVDQVHKALWNQGLASLLLVISDDTLRAYSLAQIPSQNGDLSDKLVKVFTLVDDALELKNLVLGIESGRFIASHEGKFNSNYRIDQVLLGNLERTVERLVDQDMQLNSAQALLMQVMFIAYLEDKEIIKSEYFQKATANLKINSLKTLLSDGRSDKFGKLFRLLKKHFNGDLFVAPCSFDPSEEVEELSVEHIGVISEFRAGNINLSSGQYQFWPYDFRFIPIDLISAVYDRFLGFDPVAKRESGAYYTPMFLADLVTEQAWSELSKKQKTHGHYVDPSCGSGIFLVRFFEKMVDEWRANHNNQRPPWPALLSMLRRLHGFDIKKESIRVAAFSLYVALLENTKPTEILALMEKGRLLPRLCGATLNAVDFFEVPAKDHRYDLVIGNPPWVSRRGDQKSAEKWCKDNNHKMPAKEIAWGFAWKSLAHTNENGVIALLLKATSFLTSQSQTIVNTRKQWMDDIRLIRIINFADTCFQLFEGGDAPTALAIYKTASGTECDYSFDYWVPKADLNLKTKRLMTLSSADQAKLPIQLVNDDQLLMKRRMWMQTPDAKLFQYLNGFPKLSEMIVTYQSLGNGLPKNQWVIGQGFNPAQETRLEEENYKTTKSKVLTKLPHLDMNIYRTIVMPTIEDKSWTTNRVYRKNFEAGYFAPHILIPQGIERDTGRLRASYCSQDLSFRTSIQSIKFDNASKSYAKFLTVLLNSSLVAWHLFHNSSVSGMERYKVPQQEVLSIPFPSLDDLRSNKRSARAFERSVELIDKLLVQKDELLQADMTEFISDIDKIVYACFGLSTADVQLIEDTINHTIPSMQPRSRTKKIPSLWEDTDSGDWKRYSKWLCYGLGNWLEKPCRAVVKLVGASPDLIVIGIHLTEDKQGIYFEDSESDGINEVLPKIWAALPQNMPGNFQLVPDLRIFIDDVLYLVKPRKRRFWLGSTALADADAIASDLLINAG